MCCGGNFREQCVTHCLYTKRNPNNQPWKRADGSVEPPRRQRGGAVPGPIVSRGLRVSHVPPHIRGAGAQAAFRELMAAAPRVIIDYGKPYEDDFEFRPNELTPRHFKCVGE